ncbi:acyl-CoA Delta-9 desaturase-like [Diabrotica undecimpunctata]|uniref:acyl-CoA Delta-9 desaturase-like n=1 Tax=Diabrotica undecimpunctata TaxID=50387 RepID=UPI003B641E52
MITTLTQLSEESQPLVPDPVSKTVLMLPKCNDNEPPFDTNGNISKSEPTVEKIEETKEISDISDNSDVEDNVENNNNVENIKDNAENIKNEKPLPHYEKYKFLFWEFETPVIWVSVFFIALWHLLSVYMVCTFPLFDKIPLVIYATVIGGISGFGVTGGAHRYFTHKSYKARLPLKIILLICYSVAGQNTLYDWVRDHRVHHKFSETDADPHNAKRGFFFSHVGWLMMRKHPEVIRKGRTINLTDITGDPLVAFHVKYWFWFKMFFCFVLPSSIPPLLWGESWYHSICAICFVRYVVSLNSTWAVNSFAHFFGNKPYDNYIRPAENLTVSFFAMGEGYHNYHHTFPWDYRAAEVGQMLNVTTLWLNFFEKIGWAYELRAPSSDLIQRITRNRGDGSHEKWGHEVPETYSCPVTPEVRKEQ